MAIKFRKMTEAEVDEMAKADMAFMALEDQGRPFLVLHPDPDGVYPAIEMNSTKKPAKAKKAKKAKKPEPPAKAVKPKEMRNYENRMMESYQKR